MPGMDLNDAIKQMVETEVARQLEEHQENLTRLAAVLAALSGAAPARRGPGRPRAEADAAPAAARRGPGRKPRGKAASGAKEAAGKFKEGDEVKYKQGRGEFVAKVIGVDADSGFLKLERVEDGKKVERPADKVYT